MRWEGVRCDGTRWDGTGWDGTRALVRVGPRRRRVHGGGRFEQFGGERERWQEQLVVVVAAGDALVRGGEEGTQRGHDALVVGAVGVGFDQREHTPAPRHQGPGLVASSGSAQVCATCGTWAYATRTSEGGGLVAWEHAPHARHVVVRAEELAQRDDHLADAIGRDGGARTDELTGALPHVGARGARTVERRGEAQRGQPTRVHPPAKRGNGAT
jgi:hypothetical protein